MAGRGERKGRGGGPNRLHALTAVALALVGGAIALLPRPGAVEARAAAPNAARLEGLGRVIDGDTLDVGAVRVRLHGIDAFERNQICDRAQGTWACGAAAADALKSRAEGRRLVCQVLDTDRYGRKVSRCEHGGVDVARALVAEGLALAYRRYSQDYVAEETTAQARGVGAWDGSFDRPEQWRSRGRRPAPS